MIASSLAYYSYNSSFLSRNVEKSSICLTCKKKQSQGHFDDVDICLMTAPQIMTLEPHNLTLNLCGQNSCYDFESKPFCAVSLSVENRGIGEVKFLSGQNCSTKAQTNSATIDLICPQHFKLSSFVERTVMGHFNFTSNCMICKSDRSLNRELLITMCTALSFPPSPHYEVYKFTYMKFYECDKEDESKCEIGVPKKIHDGLYCGSKLGPEPSNPTYIRFDYIPCDTENGYQSQVKN